MQFKYDGKPDERECVAFIDGEGDLWVKTDKGSCLIFEGSEYTEPSTGDLWLPETAIKKFYPGDKLTITF